MSYKPSDSYAKMFTTSNPTTGAIKDADSLPTATADFVGSGTGAMALTVTNVSTGLYRITGTIPNSRVKGDVFNTSVSATVLGVTGGAVVDTQVIDSKRVGDLVDAPVLTDYQQRGVAITLPTNPPTDWLNGASVKADAVTKIQAGLSTYAGGPVASVTNPVTVANTTGYSLNSTEYTNIAIAVKTDVGHDTTAGSLGQQFTSVYNTMALYSGLMITGKITATPTPTTTSFTVTLDVALSAGKTEAGLVGQYLTIRAGGPQTEANPITSCVINSTTSISLTFTTPFSVAPATNDPVSISE